MPPRSGFRKKRGGVPESIRSVRINPGDLVKGFLPDRRRKRLAIECQTLAECSQCGLV
jgi:hypothetical protein